MPTPQQRHHEKVEKRLLEKFHVKNVLSESEESAKINAMVARVAKLAAEDSLREDGFFFVDGKYSASRMYKYTPGMVNRTFDGHTMPVCSVCPLVDGKHIITLGMASMRLWSMSQEEFICQLDRIALTSTINHCLINGSVSTKHVAVCAGMNPAIVEIGDKCLIPREIGKFGHDGVITSSCFNHDGSILVTASMDTTCIFWKVETMEIMHVLQAHEGGVSWCGFSPDGNYLLTSGAMDYRVKLWHVNEFLRDVKSHDDGTNSIVSTEQLTSRVATMSEVHSPIVNLPTEIPSSNTHSSSSDKVIESEVQHENTQREESTSSCPDVTTESGLSEENNITSTPAKLQWSQRQKYDRSLDALFSPDLTLQTLTLVNHLPQFKFNDDWCRLRRETSDSLLLPPLYSFQNPDGTIGFREADDDPAFLSQLESIDILKLLDPSSCILPPAQCERVCYGAYDVPNSIQVIEFQVKTGEQIFVQHTHTINGCAFTKDGGQVISVASDKCIKFWNGTNGHHLHTIRDGHDREILCCAISQHETQYLATGGSDSFVKVWNTETYECIMTLRGHYDSIVSVAFGPSGHCVYSSSRDTQVVKWQVIPTAPDAPNQPQVEKIDCHSIDISWNEPLGNGAKIDNYIIQTIRVDGIPTLPNIVISANETAWSVVDLEPGCLYAFSVAAVNRIGVSDYSAVSIPVETLAYRPSKIKKPCSVSDVETRSIALEWLIPSANGAKISHYHIRCIPEDPSGIESTFDLRYSVEEIENEIQAKQHAIQADMELKARKRDERQAASQAKKTKRSAANVSRNEKSKKQSELRRVARGTIAKSVAVKPVALVHLSFRVKSLQPGTIYQFAIAAENRCGVGEYTVPSAYIKTTSCEPNTPATPTISGITSHTIDMNWMKPRENGSEILHYTIEWKEENKDVQNLIVLARNLPTTTYKIDKLAPGRQVQVRLGASNVIDKKLRDSQFSPWSQVITTLPSPPDAPRHTCLLIPTSYTLKLQFKAPCENGKPIFRYHAILFIEEENYGVIARRFLQELQWTLDELVFDQKDTYEVIISSLKASKRYTLSLSAENELGKGDYSEVSLPATTKPAVVPAPILMSPVVLNIQPTKLDLEWMPPEHDGGSTIIAYAIEYSINDGPFENELRVQKMNLTLDFIKPKTNYSFRVAGVNTTGAGIFSPPSTTIRTPSLVEFTLYNYFINRPPHEHTSARLIQSWFRVKTKEICEKQARTTYLITYLRNWSIL